MSKLIVLVVSVLVVSRNCLIGVTSETRDPDASGNNVPGAGGKCKGHFARPWLMDKPECGDPESVTITLSPPQPSEEISPKTVLIKRCVGVCEGYRRECVGDEKQFVDIAVRIVDSITQDTSCMLYHIEEHVTCRC